MVPGVNLTQTNRPPDHGLGPFRYIGVPLPPWSLEGNNVMKSMSIRVKAAVAVAILILVPVVMLVFRCQRMELPYSAASESASPPEQTLDSSFFR